MFEAGRRSFVAFCSNRMRPESREATLIPTSAGSSSGFRRIVEILVCSSESDFAGLDIFACDSPTVAEGETRGVATGLDMGEGVGLGIGLRGEFGVGVGAAL
jgi:hypothetical protein